MTENRESRGNKRVAARLERINADPTRLSAMPPPVYPGFIKRLGHTVTPLSAADSGHLKENGGFVLSGIPVPPSENEIYANSSRAGGKGRVKTAKARAYTGMFKYWAMTNLKAVGRAADFLEGEQTARCHVFLGLKHERLFTKDGRPKRIDGPNFLKLLLDCLATVLERDDSIWFSVSVCKYAVAEGKPENVAIKLCPADMLTPVDVERALHGVNDIT